MKMISGKGRFNFTKKLYFLVILSAAFIFMPAASFAQDLPCGGDDPYGNCPLDTSVWLIVVIAVFAGALFIYRQQKMQQKAS